MCTRELGKHIIRRHVGLCPHTTRHVYQNKLRLHVVYDANLLWQATKTKGACSFAPLWSASVPLSSRPTSWHGAISVRRLEALITARRRYRSLFKHWLRPLPLQLQEKRPRVLKGARVVFHRRHTQLRAIRVCRGISITSGPLLQRIRIRGKCFTNNT